MYQEVAEDVEVHVRLAGGIDADGAAAVLWPGAEHRPPRRRAQQDLRAVFET